MKKQTDSKEVTPLALGSGLVALDVVITEGNPHPRRWAGGTCGNVLLALRYLGWRAAPVARLRDGEAANHILDDLRHWGVSTEFITVAEDGSTPVIVQRIGRTSSGEPYHSFSWRCPSCGTRLPGYKPVLASVAHQLLDRLGTPRVFFFDRVSRGTLVLAQACAERGAVVAFEPSSVGNPALFREAWKIAHFVKYSHERLRDLPAEIEADRGARLQIETLGRDGLRYRSRLPGCTKRSWQRLPALPVDEVKDTAGAGDWCMAGILDGLGRDGVTGLRTATDEAVRDAVRHGQALASWNCGFEGARGGMYFVNKADFRGQVERILRAGEARGFARPAQAAPEGDGLSCLCPSCELIEEPRRELRGGRMVKGR